MLHHPRDHRMIDRNLHVDPSLEAQLHRAEQASQKPDAHLRAAIRHRIIRHRILLAHLLHVFELDLRKFNGSTRQSLDRRLVVGFHDDARMA